MGFEWGWDDINWIAVVVAFAANMALGFVWYSPKTLLPMWKEDIGITDEKIESAGIRICKLCASGCPPPGERGVHL